MSNIGFYTTLELPSKRGFCNYFGCRKKATKNGFCSTCGKIEVSVLITKSKTPSNGGFDKYQNNKHKKKNT